jgi:hypothetical protein
LGQPDPFAVLCGRCSLSPLGLAELRVHNTRLAASNSSFEGFAMVPTRYALDDLQLKCIGLITAEWSMVEAVLSVAIWDFCGLDRTRVAISV